jgi:hypothetical protein
MMDNEYRSTRGILSKTSAKATPPGFGEAVMRKVHGVEAERARKRIFLALVLRGACIAAFVCLLGGALIPALRGFGQVDWWKVVEWAEAIGLLAVGIKVFRILV